MFFRLTRYVTSPDELRLSADDSDILLYNRVSCNLVNDPDIQSAIFKSASAENLPKSDPLLQVGKVHRKHYVLALCTWETC